MSPCVSAAPLERIPGDLLTGGENLDNQEGDWLVDLANTTALFESVLGRHQEESRMNGQAKAQVERST